MLIRIDKLMVRNSHLSCEGSLHLLASKRSKTHYHLQGWSGPLFFFGADIFQHSSGRTRRPRVSSSGLHASERARLFFFARPFFSSPGLRENVKLLIHLAFIEGLKRDHPFYLQLQQSQIVSLHHKFGHTTMYRTLRPIAHNRSQWQYLVFPR